MRFFGFSWCVVKVGCNNIYWNELNSGFTIICNKNVKAAIFPPNCKQNCRYIHRCCKSSIRTTFWQNTKLNYLASCNLKTVFISWLGVPWPFMGEPPSIRQFEFRSSMLQTTSPRVKIMGVDQGTGSLLTVKGVVLTTNGWDRDITRRTYLKRKLRRDHFDEVFEALLW